MREIQATKNLTIANRKCEQIRLVTNQKRAIFTSYYLGEKNIQ